MFRQVGDIQQLLDAMSSSLSLFTDGNSTNLDDVLSNPLVSGAMSDAFGIDLSELSQSLDSLGGGAGDMMGTLANITQCVKQDRLRGFGSEGELEAEAETLAESNNILAGNPRNNILEGSLGINILAGNPSNNTIGVNLSNNITTVNLGTNILAGNLSNNILAIIMVTA